MPGLRQQSPRHGACLTGIVARRGRSRREGNKSKLHQCWHGQASRRAISGRARPAVGISTCRCCLERLAGLLPPGLRGRDTASAGTRRRDGGRVPPAPFPQPGVLWVPGSRAWSTVGIPSAVSCWHKHQHSSGTSACGARLVARTRWHLKVIGKGKERGTWPLPWLPPNILQHGLQAVIPVLHRRDGLWQGRKGWMAPACAVWFWGKLRLPLARSTESSAQPRLGGGSVHNHPPNAPKSLSPRRDPALAAAGARLGAGMRSQVSVSIRVTPAPKQTQLGVERSPSRDVADVSPLPSSPFATRDAMLMGPRPCCPGVTRWAPWWQVAFASCPGRWGKRHRRHDGRGGARL